MIKKSKSLSHEPFKVSRLAFVHPVVLYIRAEKVMLNIGKVLVFLGPAESNNSEILIRTYSGM